MFVYPTDDTDDLQKLAALVGSFWTDAYGGNHDVVDLLRTHRVTARQLGDQVQELADSVGRHTCPVFHTHNLYPLVIDQSTETPAAVGDWAVAYSLPAEVADCWLVASDIVSPAVLYHAGADFIIDNQQLLLLTSPFTDARIEPETVFDETGSVVDQRLTLWLVRASLDWQYLAQQFGYLTGLTVASTAIDKQRLNAHLDAVASGTSYDAIARLVSTASDVSLVRNAVETVEDITTGLDTILVVTDREVYSFPAGSTLLVSIGDMVRRNDSLVDTVQIWEAHDGTPPSFLSSITIGAGLLIPGIGDLTFTDADVALAVTTGVSGYTKLTWALDGDAGDVTDFFTALHSRGVTATATLANYLDQRTVKVGQPDATMLPTTINPFRFVFENVLRYHAVVIRLRPSLFGLKSLGVASLAALREVVSPHTTIIIVSE